MELFFETLRSGRGGNDRRAKPGVERYVIRVVGGYLIKLEAEGVGKGPPVE